MELQLIASSIGVFQEGQTLEAYQILTYQLSASDLLRDIKVSAVFPEPTRVSRVYASYSVDLEGYTAQQNAPNHVVVALPRDLDVSRTATIYLMTVRPLNKHVDPRLVLPNIHVEGKDKNGGTIYK